ncbi:MAG: hypothetical protein WBG30_12315 [Psychrilyobacter sp.]|uniref:hypothetical protein n=1 Tax=Psychrilyobacter sp. TaxID=2586924 RepID=UPI003C72CCAD
MENLHKNIKVLWKKNNISFERGIYLEGDLNIGNLELEIVEYIPESQLNITFYNENEKKLYVKKTELQEKNIIKIPNEVLQIAGTVFIRLTQEKNESILQATEEIYFYVVKKKAMKT